MSDLPISSMNFKQLRSEVQSLRDELAMMKRHYEDLLYNLDDDNILSISADKVEGLDDIVANNVFSESTVTESLYAEYGDIAELTVDRISTAKRIKKYLTNDISDDNYFEGYGNGIYWCQAVVKLDENGIPLTEQLTNRYKKPLYWNREYSFINSEGNVYDSEGKQVLVTEKSDSGIPVMVFKYKVNVKTEISFWKDSLTGIANPRIVMGIGTDVTDTTDNGKAFIEKTDAGLRVQYISSGGEPHCITIKDDGVYQARGDGENRIPFFYSSETTPPDTMGKDGDICFVSL